jgi:hypothetical protein
MSAYPVVISSSVDLDVSPNQGFDHFYIDATSNNITVTLQNILADGIYYTIIRQDNSSNTVTLQPKNSQTINNSSSISLEPNKMTKVVSYGSNYIAPLVSFTWS